MAKRFTDTNKYKKPFIRGLQGAYKLLWDYLYHDCDHAGIWIVDFDIAQIYIGSDMPINKEDALKYFNSDEDRIIEIDNGSKWFIPSFIDFQYGELNDKNRAHNSVILILNKYNLLKNNKPLKRPLQGCKDKDKDMDKDMDKDKEYSFDEFWEKYPVKKSKKDCRKKYDKLSNLTRQKIKDTINSFISYKPFETYTHPNPSTYINQERWNDEIEIKPEINNKPKIIVSNSAMFGLSKNLLERIYSGELTEDEAMEIQVSEK